MRPSCREDGLVAVVKRDCPTCVMTAPVLGELARRAGLTVYTQDDPGFPGNGAVARSRSRPRCSHRLRIEIVPTLIRFEGGREVARTYGWDRAEWERLTGIAGLGHGLPESQPGCGAKNIEPGDNRTPQGAVQRDRPEVPPRRDRRRRGRAGGDVRARLVGRSAIGAADRRARPAHARRHRARPAGSHRPGAAGARPGDGREDRDQRRDGRLQAGISAGRAGRGRGRARRIRSRCTASWRRRCLSAPLSSSTGRCAAGSA